MPTVPLTWKLRLGSACIYLVFVVAFLNLKLKFEEITSVINPALEKYFPSDSGVRITAQPGRYYVSSALTLAVNIIASPQKKSY